MHGTVLRNCNARFSWTKNAIRAYCALLLEFGTNSVQLRERKNGPLAPKRHQIKHLDFLILLLESRRSVVRNHSPRPPHASSMSINKVISGHLCPRRVFCPLGLIADLAQKARYR